MSIFSKIKTFMGKPESVEAGASPDQESSESSERRKNKRIDAPKGTKILVIDDSKTICALLKKMLSQNHYQVTEALSAENGLKLAFKETPDLIFLDIVLPGMSGFAALRTLRKEAATQNIPVIMISGNELATEKYYAERIGADDFMKKPFSRYEVFHRIEKLIEKKLLVQR